MPKVFRKTKLVIMKFCGLITESTLQYRHRCRHAKHWRCFLFCLVFREPARLFKERHRMQTAAAQAHWFLCTGDYTNMLLCDLAAHLSHYCEPCILSLSNMRLFCPSITLAVSIHPSIHPHNLITDCYYLLVIACNGGDYFSFTFLLFYVGFDCFPFHSYA